MTSVAPLPHLSQSLTADDLQFKNMFLAFSPNVEARFEAETGKDRGEHLRLTILIGLIFYNVYQVTNFLLMPDVVWLGFALRVLVTGGSLVLAGLVTLVSARTREWLVTGGVIIASAMPLFLFWTTKHSLGAYTFIELPLALVFGTMMLVLRFPNALVFVGVVVLAMIAAVMTKSELPETLKVALTLQTITAAFLVIYGNYRVELVRRRGYLTSLREIMRSDSLETDRRQFAKLSATDALTGLANRRHLDEILAAWDNTAVHDRRAMAVLMIDVDHFKVYNDAYGHLAGDRCLKRVAAAIRGAIRTDIDNAFRFGGEEFAVLFERYGANDIELVSSRIRAAVEALELPHRGRPDRARSVTVSIGGAIAGEQDSNSAEILMKVADEALYDAKRRGRNCICLRSLDASPPNQPSPISRAA